MEKRSRLGRGLSSLLNPGIHEAESPIVTDSSTLGANPVAGSAPLPPPGATPGMPVAGPELFHVELSLIKRNVNQPRKQFDEATLASLAASVKEAGVIQPIIVQRVNDGYEVIAGERRFRAAQLAGLSTVPVIVRKIDPLQQSQIALIENIHREDLNPIDRAQAYRNILQQLGLTHAELAARLGEERSGIANYLRLLDLPGEVQALVRQASVSVGHAKLLCGLDDLARIQKLAKRVVSEQLSVRALEKLIKEGPASIFPAIAKPATPHIADLERQISRDLQMRTEVKQAKKGGKGRVVIHYASLDQFDELLSRLGIKVED